MSGEKKSESDTGFADLRHKSEQIMADFRILNQNMQLRMDFEVLGT